MKKEDIQVVQGKRWTQRQTQIAVKAAHPFRYPSPSEERLQAICEGYERITGEPVRRHSIERYDRKANFLAACYRVHGDDFLPLVQEVYDSTGTTLNLLGIVRSYPPRNPVASFVDVTTQPSADVVDHAPLSRPPVADDDLGPDLYERFDELDPYQSKEKDHDRP